MGGGEQDNNKPVKGDQADRQDDVNEFADEQTWKDFMQSVAAKKADEWERIDKYEAELDPADSLIIEKPAEKGDWTYVSHVINADVYWYKIACRPRRKNATGSSRPVSWLARLREGAEGSKLNIPDDKVVESDTDDADEEYVILESVPHEDSNTTQPLTKKKSKSKRDPPSGPKKHPKPAT